MEKPLYPCRQRGSSGLMLDLSRNLCQKLLDLGIEATEQVGVGDETNRAVDLQFVGFEADQVLLKLGVSSERFDLLGEFGASGTRDGGRRQIFSSDHG